MTHATTPTTATTSTTTTATTVAATTSSIAGGSAAKRRRLTDPSDSDHHLPLLPGLPDHIAQLCLSRVHPSTLYSVSRSWRSLVYSPHFPPFLSLYALFLPTPQTTDQSHHHHPIEFLSFDPISANWLHLPPPPPQFRPIRYHPSFLFRNLPIQSVSVSGNLVVLAATADNLIPALPRPLVFNPVSQKWRFGPPLGTPRRWCAAGSSGGEVFVASGIGSHFTTDVARSVEKWDIRKNQDSLHHRRSCGGGGFSEFGWSWEKLGAMRDGRFSREAIDAVGWRGMLCMVNVKGDSAKQGLVYDVASDDWAEMPEGMMAGWRGPAAAMDEETLYALDESKGVLRKYDADSDGWEEIVGDERLRGAEQMAAAGGRVCVVCCGGGGGILVVDVVASPPRLWEVDTPAGFQTVAVHILPRMSRPD